jgi:hypothetical protein
MSIEMLNHGDVSCQIDASKDLRAYCGTLRYKVFEVGQISGPSIDAVRAQFKAICEMTDSGGMVRHGIIMLGYHNKAFCGDVLRIDGEFIGEWTSDDEEWCYFTAIGNAEATLTAPSPWMLHDSIADWLDTNDRSETEPS